MIVKLFATVAAFAVAGTAVAHPLPAKPGAAARTAALDSIMGEVQLDALIAKVVPADAAKRTAAGHRAIVAAAPAGKLRERSQA